MMDYLETYRKRFESTLVPLAVWLENDFEKILSDIPGIDRICARAKGFDSFKIKALKRKKGRFVYSDPLNQIQDQIGVRVIVFFLTDVEPVAKKVMDYFTKIEIKDHVPESESEFGYVGKHFILKVPSDFRKGVEIKFFELQIKTLFQHAWSEASHDLIYKAKNGLTSDQKRKAAFTAAQSWGADRIFEELKLQIN